jgi:hypothetical protein
MTEKSNSSGIDELNSDEKIAKILHFLDEIGLERMADDISQQKFANRVVESQISANYWHTAVLLWEMKEDRLIQDVISIQSALFDKSASYNNIVSTLGYAGFFAIWSIVNKGLSFEQNAFVGMFLGLSLLIFIIWTLINSFLLTVGIRKRALFLSQERESRQDEIEAYRMAEASIDRMFLNIQKWWVYIFSLSTALGLIAGIFLLAVLLQQMIGFEWPYIKSFCLFE